MTGFSKFYNSRQFKYIIIAVWIALIVVCLINADLFTIDNIISFVPENKVLAAIIIMVLFALKSLSVFIYSGILFATVGLIFDLPVALGLSAIGSIIIATIPYLIGRSLGDGQIEKLEAKYPKLSIMKEMRNANDFLFVILMRMIEFVPYDASSIYMGASGLKFRNYILASVIGMIQVSVPTTIMGNSVEDPSSPMFIAAVCFQIGLTVISLIVSYFYIKKIKSKKS